MKYFNEANPKNFWFKKKGKKEKEIKKILGLLPQRFCWCFA